MALADHFWPDFALEWFPDPGGYQVRWSRVAGAPTVILLHEMAGLSHKTVTLARRFVHAGFSVALPALLPPVVENPGLITTVKNARRICISDQFMALAHRQDRPVTNWIRALAAREAEVTQRGVGIVGMCMTGNLALAAAIEPGVRAAVASQPAIPPSYLSYTPDLAMSSDTFDALADKAGRGFCVRVLRFQSDFISRRARMQFIQNSLPNAQIVEIPTRNPFRHSVLTSATRAGQGTRLDAALTETFDYLRERLVPL